MCVHICVWEREFLIFPQMTASCPVPCISLSCSQYQQTIFFCFTLSCFHSVSKKLLKNPSMRLFSQELIGYLNHKIGLKKKFLILTTFSMLKHKTRCKLSHHSIPRRLKTLQVWNKVLLNGRYCKLNFFCCCWILNRENAWTKYNFGI